jgi:hypothetical protein
VSNVIASKFRRVIGNSSHPPEKPALPRDELRMRFNDHSMTGARDDTAKGEPLCASTLFSTLIVDKVIASYRVIQFSCATLQYSKHVLALENYDNFDQQSSS